MIRFLVVGDGVVFHVLVYFRWSVCFLVSGFSAIFHRVSIFIDTTFVNNREIGRTYIFIPYDKGTSTRIIISFVQQYARMYIRSTMIADDKHN